MPRTCRIINRSLVMKRHTQTAPTAPSTSLHAHQRLHPLMHKAQNIPLCRVQVCRRLGNEGGEGITRGLSRGGEKSLCSLNFQYAESEWKGIFPQVEQFPPLLPPVQGTCTELTAASLQHRGREKPLVYKSPKGLMNSRVSLNFPH